MWLVIFIVGSGLAGFVIGGVAGRFAFVAGGVLLLMGLGPMAALLIHSQIVGPGGDRSSEGMLATMAFVFFVPAGITAALAGVLRR